MKIFCPTHGVQTTRPCPACRKRRDRARGSPASRGYGGAWRKIRAEILPPHLELVCEWERGCTERATEVHHRDGNPANNDPSNHQRLCKSHHSRITATQQRGSAA